MVQQFPLFVDKDEARDMYETFESSSGSVSGFDPTDILAVCIDVFSAMPTPSQPVRIMLSGDMGHNIDFCEDRVLDVLTSLMSTALPASSSGCEDTIHLSVKVVGDVLRIDFHSASAGFTGVIWDCQTALEPFLTRSGEASHVAWWNDRGWCLTAYVNLESSDPGVPWLALSESGKALPFKLESKSVSRNSASTSLLIVLGD